MKALLLIAVLVMGFGTAYGTEVTVDVPFDFWNQDFCTFMGFPLENGTIVYEFECIWVGWKHQIVEEWQWLMPDDIVELPLRDAPDAFVVIPPADRVEPEAEPIVDQMDLGVQEFLHPEEPSTPEERELEQAIEKLAECRTGLGAFAAYQESEAIEHYTDQSRWQFAIRDNLSQNPQVGNILKGIEECRIMKKYADMNLIGAYELNKILADLAGLDYLGRTAEHPLATKVTDQSDSSVFTDPVTPKDIAQEVAEMERLRDKLIEERVFEDPDAPLSGENRGGQTEGARCQVFGQPAPVGVWATEKCPLSLYDAHILKNWEAITYSDIKQLQCDNFLYIYQHKIGTHEFPVWLNHCVPKVVREG